MSLFVATILSHRSDSKLDFAATKNDFLNHDDTNQRFVGFASGAGASDVLG